MNPERVTTIDLAKLPDGSRHAFDLEVAPLADGRSLSVPVQVLAGTGARPVFVAMAGVHGDEPEGMVALLDLARELDPGRLNGRLVIVPVANPPAFAAGSRLSPLDHLDLNRSFPGRGDGGPSLRLAHRLFETLVKPADLLFTLHSWYSYGIAEDFIECPPQGGSTAAAALRAARASGFRRIRVVDWPEGLLARVAIANGVPAIEAEIGGMGRSLPENRARYRDHVKALLRHLGMMEGAPTTEAAELCEARHVPAPAGGLLRMRARLGEVVEAGAMLATIHDLHDRPLAEVIAPWSGRIGAHRTFVSVNPGDNLFTIFRPIGDAAGSSA
jgi:predicted deacylase